MSLTENITISSPFELNNGKTVKVNLNGKSITCNNGSDAFVVTDGTLTIEGEGTVTTQDNTAGYAIIAKGADAVVYVKGGNYVMKRYPDRVAAIDVSDPYELMDADTPEILEELRQKIG